MVLPVSGFLPVPLPMMIPFMGAQSLVIGKMFGEGFQYGKRKISAMSNEEFNKLTFEDMMSNARTELKASIPTMQAALQDMQPMVETVVREFFNYITLITKITTGTGEGPNIFQKEGHDIGDWIQQQLGIPHTPHSGTGANIPVTPNAPQISTFTPPTNIPTSTPTTTSTTIQQPTISTAATVRQKAGQTQIIERLRLVRLINYHGNRVRGAIGYSAPFNSDTWAILPSGSHRVTSVQDAQQKKDLLTAQQLLVNLLQKYIF